QPHVGQRQDLLRRLPERLDKNRQREIPRRKALTLNRQKRSLLRNLLRQPPHMQGRFSLTGFAKLEQAATPAVFGRQANHHPRSIRSNSRTRQAVLAQLVLRSWSKPRRRLFSGGK